MAQKGNKAAFKKINVEDLIINDLTEENIHQYTESEDVRNELCDKLQSDFLKHSADMADLQKRSEHLVEMMRIVSEKHTQVKTIECNNVLSKKLLMQKRRKNHLHLHTMKLMAVMMKQMVMVMAMVKRLKKQMN